MLSDYIPYQSITETFYVFTHWGRDNSVAILKCIILNEKVRSSLKNSLRFVPKVQINNIPTLVQTMSWSWQGDKPLSVPMMVSLLAHICVTRHQWINPEFALPDFGYYHIVSCLNSLWPSDAIWRHRSELTLARIMSCCLTSSNHYLNKSCFIIESVLWHSTGRNFTRTVHDLYRSMRSEITLTTLSPHLPGANELSPQSVASVYILHLTVPRHRLA